jgi:MYXO-CTERM domain-containing protein
MLIRTHVLHWIGNCEVWVTEWLSPERWSALPHVARVVVTVGCVGGAGVLPMLPTPTIDVNPHSPRAWLPAPDVVYARAPEADFLPPIGVTTARRRAMVPTPEPGGMAVLVVALGGLALARRRAVT